MSPWFHPNFPFETLLLRTWSNHHKFKLVNLSVSGGIFLSSFKQALSSLFSKNIFIHWYLHNFRLNPNPNFIYKILKNVVASRIQYHLSSDSLSSFHSAYRIFHSNAWMNLLFLKFTMALSSQWILVRTLNSFFSTYLLHLIYCRSFHHSHSSSKLVRPWWSFSWLVLISSPFLLSSSLNQWFHIPSLHSLLSPVVYPKVSYWVHSFSFSIQLLLALWSKKSLKYHLYVRWYADETHLYNVYISFKFHFNEFCSLSIESPPLSLTFSPGWTWTNCFFSYQKVNFPHPLANNLFGLLAKGLRRQLLPGGPWRAPSAPRAPRGRGACEALATPLHPSQFFGSQS